MTTAAARRHFLKLTVATGAASLVPGLAFAGDATIFQSGGAAIRGYDVMSYWTDGKPIPGKADFTHDYKGATWRFASAANRDKFAADPARYAPQYEGYCAYGAAQGYAVEVDPEQWAILDDKLYLNYSGFIQLRWKLDTNSYIKSADANWPKIRPGNKTGRPL